MDAFYQIRINYRYQISNVFLNYLVRRHGLQNVLTNVDHLKSKDNFLGNFFSHYIFTKV